MGIKDRFAHQMLSALAAIAAATAPATGISQTGHVSDRDSVATRALTGPLAEKLLGGLYRDNYQQVSSDLARLGHDYLKSHPSALMTAAENCSPQIVGYLLDHGASATATDVLGRTALMFAQRADVARLLLARGADPNAQDRSGTTVLMHAADENAGVATVRALLAAGALKAVKNNTGRTAYDFALHCRRPSNAELIRLDYRAPVEARHQVHMGVRAGVGYSGAYGNQAVAALLKP